jgi:hypothetical protein
MKDLSETKLPSLSDGRLVVRVCRGRADRVAEERP